MVFQLAIRHSSVFIGFFAVLPGFRWLPLNASLMPESLSMTSGLFVVTNQHDRVT